MLVYGATVQLLLLLFCCCCMLQQRCCCYCNCCRGCCCSYLVPCPLIDSNVCSALMSQKNATTTTTMTTTATATRRATNATDNGSNSNNSTSDDNNSKVEVKPRDQFSGVPCATGHGRPFVLHSMRYASVAEILATMLHIGMLVFVWARSAIHRAVSIRFFLANPGTPAWFWMSDGWFGPCVDPLARSSSLICECRSSQLLVVYFIAVNLCVNWSTLKRYKLLLQSFLGLRSYSGRSWSVGYWDSAASWRSSNVCGHKVYAMRKALCLAASFPWCAIMYNHVLPHVAMYYHVLLCTITYWCWTVVLPTFSKPYFPCRLYW